MNEFTHKTTGPGIDPRVRRMQRRRVRHLHSHRHHRLGGCGSQPDRTPGAATAASGSAPCMSCTGHWQTSPAPATTAR